MTQNRAFQAVVRSNERMAPAPQASELSADDNARMPAGRMKFRRPSQVPVLSDTATPAGPGVRQALSEPGEPLDQGIRGWMEDRFESDFSDVRIYRGSGAAWSARALGADAYTAGNRIVFAPGKYDTASADGRHVLAHELAHVIQQRSGLVSGLSIGGDVAVSQPHDSFEEAAEYKAREIMGSSGTPRSGEGRRHPAGISTQTMPAAVLLVQRFGGQELFNISSQVTSGLAGVLSIASALTQGTAQTALGAASGGFWTISAILGFISAVWPRLTVEEIRALPQRINKLENWVYAKDPGFRLAV